MIIDWIAGINIDNKWKVFTEQLENWYKLVFLNSIEIFSDSKLRAGKFVYTYDAAYSNTKFSKSVDRAFQVIDGWVKNPHEIRNPNITTIGEFSFLYAANDKIEVISDLYTTKNIYYKIDNSSVICSNNLPLLLLLIGEPLSINNDSCLKFLSSRSVIGESELESCETYFRNIKKIAPYHKSVFTLTSQHHSPYINIQNDIIGNSLQLEHNPKIVSQNFRKIFDQAVKDRVRHDKVGLMLSGGVDSSTILASLKSNNLLDQTIAFNMSFKDPDLYIGQDNEIAKKLIKDFGIKGGIIWADNLLYIPNMVPGSEPIINIDGPNVVSNANAVEAFANYSFEFGATSLITGEHGDAVLGEDIWKLIIDSLIKSNQYKATWNLTKNIAQNSISEQLKLILQSLMFNKIPFFSEAIYQKQYWEHTNISEIPYYFMSKLKIYEKNDRQKQNYNESSKHSFSLVGHKYCFDYLFPRARYFNSISNLIITSHPYLDPRLLKFIFSNATHLHCDYLNYNPKQSYQHSKHLARQAYKDLLPDYARLKSFKTSYAGMTRKIMLNSKQGLIDLIFNRSSLYVDELELIDKDLFRKKLTAAIIKFDDPNNNLGLDFQFIRAVIELEIWLNIVNSGFNKFVEIAKPRKPRILGNLEMIN